jgi:Uma2 family endonuclease
MSQPAAHGPRMTLEEWAELDEEAEGELVDGTLQEEETPSAVHELIVGWLIGLLRGWIALSAATGIHSLPGFEGLAIDLDALWAEADCRPEVEGDEGDEEPPASGI